MISDVTTKSLKAENLCISPNIHSFTGKVPETDPEPAPLRACMHSPDLSERVMGPTKKEESHSRAEFRVLNAVNTPW